MSNIDALDALQAAVKAGYNVALVDGSNQPAPSLRQATHLRLSDSISLPKSTPTRLRKTGKTSTDPNSTPDDFVSLDAVYLAWQLRDASGAEYMKQTRDSGLTGNIGMTERKGVAEWVEGKLESLDNIVPLTGGTETGTTTPPGSPTTTAYYRTLPKYNRISTAKPPSSSHGIFGHGDSHGVLSSPSKRRYVPDANDVEVVKRIKHNEIELQDRTTVLRGIKPNNFTAVKNAFTSKLKNLKDAKKSSAPSSGATTPTSDPKVLARKAKNMYPIIVISSSPTSLITMHNVRRFLQEATFEPSQDARARAVAEGNTRPEDMIPIYRHKTTIDSSGRETTTSQRYVVVDSVEALNKFGADAWDRVVCVMTTGQAWQFRPYKWTEPRSLFHHVKGVYVSWSNDPPNPKIKDWNVTELKIDPIRRHVDKAAVAHFWKTLDDWTSQHKPALMKG